MRIEPQRCQRCDASLAGAEIGERQRRQVVDVRPPPPPQVTEHQPGVEGVLMLRCGDHAGLGRCGVPAEHADTVSRPGSPVRLGPEVSAQAILLRYGC